MPPKLLRNIFIGLITLIVLFEAVCWIFIRFPMDPPHILDINNDIPGFKKNVRIISDEDQVRYIDWTASDKPAGSVRILCIGGWATQGILQGAEDTWWGRMQAGMSRDSRAC